MTEKFVVMFDPFSGSGNLGDEIIRNSVMSTLSEVSENFRCVFISMHQRPSRKQLHMAKKADLIIASGSNLLNFRVWPLRDGRWNMSPIDLYQWDNVVLCGVGWQSYSAKSNWLGRKLFPTVLSKSTPHSARDGFTTEKLKSFGVHNVINTGCPTMWQLVPEHVECVPRKAADSVVFTLTDYNRDHVRDRSLFDALRKIYKEVYYWPQGAGDYGYLRELGGDGVHVLPPSLQAFDRLLMEHDSIDYIGTRLHAGIRALQHKRRTLIIAIDNRASEVAKDTGLPILDRTDITQLEDLVSSTSEIKISLPAKAIAEWKFRALRILDPNV